MWVASAQGHSASCPEVFPGVLRLLVEPGGVAEETESNQAIRVGGPLSDQSTLSSH